jgi:O-methyltransferase involved in polyketide biosynthesis
MTLSNVSKTAINTLIAKAVESEQGKSKFKDPMAVQTLEILLSLASDIEKKWIQKWIKRYKGLLPGDRKQIIERANILDEIANSYISENPSCTVINLACGFDTRYWRINNNNCKYIELDLPEVIELKKAILQDKISYKQIGCSVLDHSWINQVISGNNNHFLFIAEGLLYYLPKEEVIILFQEISKIFTNSQIAFDTYPDWVTKGFFKWLGKAMLGINLTFGIKKITEIESYANGIKINFYKRMVGYIIISVTINGD